MKKIIILALVSVMFFSLTTPSFAETIDWDDKDWETYLEEFEDVAVEYVNEYIKDANEPSETTLINQKLDSLTKEYASYAGKRGAYQLHLEKTDPSALDEFTAGFERICNYVEFATVDWVRYLGEFEAIAICYVDELTREESDSLEVNAKLSVFRKLFEDYEGKKELYLPKLEKYDDGRAKEFKSEWKRIANYVEWVEYLEEFEEVVDAYVEEIKKEQEHPYEGEGFNRELFLAKVAYENQAMSKHRHLLAIEKTDPDKAEEYLEKWEAINSLVPAEN